MLLCRGQRIELECLPADIRKLAEGSQEEKSPKPSDPLGEAEADAIIEALRQHNGHRGKTATALGIDKATLWRKMKRLSIRYPSTPGRPKKMQ